MPPTVTPHYTLPKFNIRVEDLSHPGAVLFFDNVQPALALKDAVLASFTHLYTPKTVPTHVKLITLVLRSMDGVAYTFGSHTDKEIHFSLDYIKASEHRARDEILGVLVHEVVHCFQYNGKDQCPGGLIEGIADFVRLHAGYAPPHWQAAGGDRWDAGYDRTAYFLDWIEKHNGEGTVQKINQLMKDRKYTEYVFIEATGHGVDKLWKMYCALLDKKSPKLTPN
ncbi:hypothetical protein SERLA73DRAFT_92786 [Serpula lacrymans var. lacrymans S7.3]|uniref:Plant basic secretory protein n=2 Tax=Serpula lacrymans var. lacrymans TaxID=341189 RepID=F8Q346_SERL3|nr:uncharacterized protein SERLADRAFT_416620 [Serpula lacrymans var. lacrymans S7.9]EGN97607.1 hypothetical protein SERLA73DRAFT_92786 [Serpula lacrymans var. lacrymans S7.3]EGO23201.1 hypothetical protein SERLADRAFT_416620 [Serpula lacrymans var. lacrymans S7.9]